MREGHTYIEKFSIAFAANVRLKFAKNESKIVVILAHFLPVSH